MRERSNVTETIKKIVKQNPDRWISSNDIIKVTGFIRQSVNDSLRRLEKQGFLIRKKEKINKRGEPMNVVKYKGDE